MNKDQLKGGLKEVAGKVQAKVGHATGSVKQEAKGVLKEAGGKFQKEYGNARDDSKNKDEAGKDSKPAEPLLRLRKRPHAGGRFMSSTADL